MSFKIKSLVAAVALTAYAGVAGATDVEVLHWWTSGGEAKSVGELKKILQARGYGWKDFAVAGGGGDNAMTVLKTRVVSGSAPTAAQIKGPAIQEWAAEGVLADISEAATTQKWDSVLPKVYADGMKYKGHYVAAPVNVHRVNWVWANPDVLKKAGVASAPKTWDEFFAAADKIQKAGLVAVAHGGQPWQDATVFESVALGVGGADFYKKAFVQLDQTALKSATMTKIFDTTARVKGYMDKDRPNRDWNLATAMVMNGKAGFQFMGDWAKGEFTAAGKVPGKDFLCFSAPGTSASYTYNIDSFAFFTQKDPEAKKAQIALAESIMSPEFQEIFNLAKGSIPVRSGVKTSGFDACAKQSMTDQATAEKAGGLVPSFAHGMALAPATQGAMVDVITKFMNSTMDTKTAVAELAKAAMTK